MTRDDADRLHRPDEVVDLLRAEQILLNLVFDDAVASLFYGEPREHLRGRRGCGRHRVDDRIDAFLAELGKLEPRLFRAARERSSLGDRCEVTIGLWRSGFSHRGRDSPPRRTRRTRRAICTCCTAFPPCPRRPPW